MKLIRKTFFAALLFCAAIIQSCTVLDETASGMSIENTVLIYIAADNNLSSSARINIRQMMEGDIPTYFESGSGNVLLVYSDISGEEPRLMRLSKDRFGTVSTETLRVYEDQNSCSDSVMNAVLSYAASCFPARQNGLILWSHGTGWVPEQYYSNPYSVTSAGDVSLMQVTEDPYAAYVKSFGVDGKAEMNIQTLANALPMRYDYIIFDACLMGGVEVAYELKDKCDYLVASSAEVLAGGLPYENIMGSLFRGYDGLVEICDAYLERYINDGATLSIVDTDYLPSLAEASLDIFLTRRMAIQNLDMDSLQGYFRNGRAWYYDLDELMQKIASRDTLDGQTRSQYDVFKDVFDNVVRYKVSTEDFVLGGSVRFGLDKFSGLSTYVPNPENNVLEEFYKTLAWNQAVMMVE